ncbi:MULTISPECIES: hypothetical protein [Bradyrhizobium]|uniref:hypothetical protein n=1 Tax=Bradyrhizobium TaxID=374 RepID=UPI001142131E|nr:MULTISPECIES: hypothetical protein [Bradyrhizobium]QOG21664.1 hypothetical protein FOM02_34580 [Bradyrhizobium sp. SEMIA]UFW51655.1 hypothetical protein BaraCB756_12060 [Bradyrhizobium arachidis]
MTRVATRAISEDASAELWCSGGDEIVVRKQKQMPSESANLARQLHRVNLQECSFARQATDEASRDSLRVSLLPLCRRVLSTLLSSGRNIPAAYFARRR